MLLSFALYPERVVINIFIWFSIYRQLALKALNERLNRADSAPQWPALIDDPKEEARTEPNEVVSEDETADASKDEAAVAVEMTPLVEAKEEGRSEPS